MAHKQPSKDKAKARKEKINRLWKDLESLKDTLYAQHGAWGPVFANEHYKRSQLAFRKAYNQCPECNSNNTGVENYDPMWQDGDIICQDCRTYVRMYDAG